MKKSNVILGIILALAILVSLPLSVFACDPPIGDWSVVEIIVTNQWITNQAGTPNATPWATDTNQVTITVQNNGEQNMPWLPFVTFKNPDGKTQSDGLTTNLDLIITDVNGTKTVIKGGTANFQYTLKAGSEEGMVDIVAKYDGNEHIIGTIKIFGHTITLFDYWTCWEDFGKYFCDVFGVDSTSPVGVISVIGHASSDAAYGSSHYWQTASLLASDQLSGVLSVVETKSADGKTITWTITDNAGNVTIKSVTLKESWAFASIAICEKCWHSFANGVGDMSGTGNFTVFAPGGWIFYKCPYCGYDTEKIMRANYKAFVERGGYVPAGDFYHGMNYKP